MNVLHKARVKPAEAVYYIAIPCTEGRRIALSIRGRSQQSGFDSPFVISHRATRNIIRLNYDRDTEYRETLTLRAAGDVSSKRWISPPKYPDKWSDSEKPLIQARVTKGGSELYTPYGVGPTLSIVGPICRRLATLSSMA
jgi:hypothetical protein